VLELARRTLDIEARALQELKARQGEGFVAAVQAMLACRGRVVVMGMGKSGHVGRKVAATLASTGTPAFFVHPAEASHGDLGMVTPDDVVLAISNSGESDEIGAIVPAIKRLGVKLVAITGGADSSLARHADVVVSERGRPGGVPAQPRADRQHHRRRWRSATPWPSPCSMRAAFARRTSRAPIRAAASAASSSCTSPT
jgi:D-arabinose 5-phosphate isomerase GutQ